MYDQNFVQKVKQLREKGLTYFEINQRLKTRIPKNTLSYWSRGIILPKWYKNKIKKINLDTLKKARLNAVKTNKIKREKHVIVLKEKNLHLVKKIDNNLYKLLLSILYLGEGAKYGRSSTLTLGSSNPLIIKLYLKLLKNTFSIDDSKFRARIQCRFDQNIKKLEKYWIEITGINKKQFYPTYVDRRTEGKPTLKKDYKGVCTIHYLNRAIQLELILLSDAIIEKII